VVAVGMPHSCLITVAQAELPPTLGAVGIGANIIQLVGRWPILSEPQMLR
jgi:hypothetical protein